MPTASQNAAMREEELRPTWPPTQQDRVVPHPPKAYTFPRGMRRFDFGSGETAAAAARAQADCADAQGPLTECPDPATVLKVTKPAVKGGTMPRAPRPPLLAPHHVGAEWYDYEHCYAIGSKPAHFFVSKSPREPPQAPPPPRQSAPCKDERRATLSPPPPARLCTIPRAQRFADGGGDGGGGLHRVVAPVVRPTTAASRGSRDETGIAVPALPRYARARSATTARSRTRREATSAKLAAIDDCIRRHISGSTFGAKRTCPFTRLGADVDLHRASRAPGPGAHRIRSTFAPVHIIQSIRGCVNAKLY